jgi:hypothetical protein
MPSFWEIEVDGVFQDFNGDLNFLVTQSFGTGMPPIRNLTKPLPLQPGSVFDNQQIDQRTWSLRGSIVAEGAEDIDSILLKRKNLIKAIVSYPSSINSQLPARRLRYLKGTTNKDIYGYYDGGLHDEPPIGWSQEDMDIRFLSPDPLFYATSETTESLDPSDRITTIRGTAGKESGIWSDLGNDSAAGAFTRINAIVSDGTYIYFGGSFTSLDGDGNFDNIVRYSISGQVFSALSTGLNGAVNALDVAPNGDLIVGGGFTNAGGVANADRIAIWDGSSWVAMGTGSPSAVNVIHTARNGNVYIGTDGTGIGGVTNADYVAYWDGSAWNAMADPDTAGATVTSVDAISSDINNNIYIGGDFTSFGNITDADYIVKWDGSAYTAMSSGLDDNVNSIVLGNDGLFYIGGGTILSSDRLVTWNGTSFNPVGSATFDDDVSDLAVNGDLVYVFSDPTTVGLSNTTGLIIWNGSTWADVDIKSLGGGLSAIGFEGDDIFVGFDTASAQVNHSGGDTISYGGTSSAYPYVEISRSDGAVTVTRCVVKSLINETTKARIYLEYPLLDGETLTLELRPHEGIKATSSKFGRVDDAILANSNQGQFFLVPDNTTGDSDNIINLFVDEQTSDGSTVVTANMKFKATYLSLDD